MCSVLSTMYFYNVEKRQKVLNPWFVHPQVTGSESIGEEDQGSDITRFLEGYRKGRTVSKKIGLSFMGFINSMIGLKLIFIIVFVVAILMVIQTIGGRYDEEEQWPVRSHKSRGHTAASSSSKPESKAAGEKEDWEELEKPCSPPFR